MSGANDVDHLTDRHPKVTPERLVAGLVPPPTFADVAFDTYRPDPGEPSQADAVRKCREFCEQAVARRAGKKKLFGKREALSGVGMYLDGGFGVGKTHLLASTYYALRAADSGPAAFATFGELTQLAGVFGFVECIELLSGYVVVCIDEFELDDPGNTTLISRLLSALVERGVSVAATSNTLPEQLGEGRFAAQDFLREIHALAARFDILRIDGLDYRRRDADGHAVALPDDAALDAAAASLGGTVTIDDFDAVLRHLATVHPSRYVKLVGGLSAVGLRGVHVLQDQTDALRFVAAVDRLYDGQVRVLATGVPLDRVFGEDMLAGGYRKKYLRAVSRLVALTASEQATSRPGE